MKKSYLENDFLISKIKGFIHLGCINLIVLSLDIINSFWIIF